MKKMFLSTWMLLSVAPSFAGEISHITVRNKNFEIVKIIDDKASLQLFELIWKTKAKEKHSVTPTWLFKIDIEGKGHGNRWLYDPTTGYLKVLSKAKVPIYKIPAPNSFNELIDTQNKGAVSEAAKDEAPHTPLSRYRE